MSNRKKIKVVKIVSSDGTQMESIDKGPSTNNGEDVIEDGR